MLITDPSLLEKYSTANRRWQGIPGIEVTPKGRMFCTFYSGMDTETMGNYAVLIKSDDGGNSWSEPIAAVDVGHSTRACGYPRTESCDSSGVSCRTHT